MVWVFGNSHERVAIKDLNDTIYFRQKKQYSNQEFEGSKDLQREIQTGRIIKLEHLPEIKGSIPENLGTSKPEQRNYSIDLSEIRRVITEVVSEQKSDNVNVRDLVTNLVPIIAETVRQEVSKISIVQGSGSSSGASVQSNAFIGPEYIPEISSVGMKSSISIEGQQVEDAGVSDSLNALRNLNKSA